MEGCSEGWSVMDHVEVGVLVSQCSTLSSLEVELLPVSNMDSGLLSFPRLRSLFSALYLRLLLKHLP